ncbi:MAG: ribonuclease BN [Planctomycetes bacterium GWF2_41_51]|nr:MAG: ribonuclease BN [Planctomycetes bacterium GWF2_41_51]HBG26718.1 YihY/virulence factor BrkB family protein [Phycisphaerales bacterium]
MFKKWIDFIETDLWRMRLKDQPRRKFFLFRLLQVIVLAYRGFNENKCRFKASALTFYSLLSMVPIVALMFAIAKGFGLQKQVEEQLLERTQGQQEVVTRIIEFSNKMLEETSGGLIAGIGVIFLFWAIIKVLSNIENSFNEIWGVIKPRSLGRKFSDYISMFLICPILLAISGSLTIFVNSQFQTLTTKIPMLQNLGLLFWLPLKMLPYVSVWILFTFIFAFMPNTKVKFTSALLAGIVAGTIFQFVQWIYVNFQIGVAKYGAIYGSFAAIPLFLIWLQTSWLIVLFGAELSFATQNVETYEFEPDCLSASKSYRTLLSLFIVQWIVKKFTVGEKAPDAPQLSHDLQIPVRLVRQLLYQLSESGVLSEVRNKEREYAYQPAIDVDKITVKFVIDRLEHHGTKNVPVLRSKELDKLSDCLHKFSETIDKSEANILLKNL